jgi:hypothetical protein
MFLPAGQVNVRVSPGTDLGDVCFRQRGGMSPAWNDGPLSTHSERYVDLINSADGNVASNIDRSSLRVAHRARNVESVERTHPAGPHRSSSEHDGRAYDKDRKAICEPGSEPDLA